MSSVEQCLKAASLHWRGRSGERVQTIRATRCGELVGMAREVKSLGPADGIKLMADLRAIGLGAKTVQDYYGTFKRALRLGGGPDTAAWPNAPTPPRKTRDPLRDEDLARLKAWFIEQGFQTTHDLAVLLSGTGMRIDVEALSRERWSVRETVRAESGEEYDILHITGKGDNERLVPVLEAECRALLRDEQRLGALCGVPYSTHLKRWARGRTSLGISSRKATPHSVRHAYATGALCKSGGNLTLVQELLGHASPGTTAKYLAVDMSAKAKALTR